MRINENSSEKSHETKGIDYNKQETGKWSETTSYAGKKDGHKEHNTFI